MKSPGSKNYDLICIGTAIVDTVIKGFDPSPVSATGYIAQSCSLNAGGEAVNVSTAAAKLGLDTAIMCHLGADAAGQLIEKMLETCRVDTGLIDRSDDHPTPVTAMFVNEDGTRRSITNNAHRYNFHPEKSVSYFSGTRAVSLGSLFRAPFDDREVVHEVLRAAKEHGAMTFADTKLPNFTFLTLEDIALSLPLIDFITPNEDEARYYSGKDDPEEMADAFLNKGVKNVIIKLGAKGCLFKNAESTVSLPAYKVRAVDATGAGDNFLAGFISEILGGRSVYDALNFANACAAISTTEVGAGTALTDRDQVLDFLGSG